MHFHNAMIPKYTVEYSIPFRNQKHSASHRYQTDDPVTFKDFLTELLERGFSVVKIEHEGLPLEGREFDRLIKVAAGTLAARHVCASLGIKPEEERHRFGFAA